MINSQIINITILIIIFALYIRGITLLKRKFTKIIALNKTKINSKTQDFFSQGVEYQVKSTLIDDDKVKLEITRTFDLCKIKVNSNLKIHYRKALLIFNPILFIAIHFMKTNFHDLISNRFLLYSYLIYGSICLGLNYYHFYNYFSVQKILLEVDEDIYKSLDLVV
jgi:hypothetical protein